MATRWHNERYYGSWDELPDGGRRYYKIVEGESGGYARYVKVVDASETTVELLQEIWSAGGTILSVHRKYPEDSGHQPVGEQS